jgi:hypothetical protein
MASGVLRIYGVHVSASPAVPPAAVPGVEGGDAAAAPSTPICSCDLYVTSEVDVGGGPEAPATPPGAAASPHAPRRARAVALAGDDTAILVALADGETVVVTWAGDVKARARPFDGADPKPLTSHAPLVALHFCPTARLAVAAFADGRVEAAPAPPGAARPPAALGRGWRLREPRAAAQRPVAVAVSGAAGLIAIGLDLGDVELHAAARPAGRAPAARVLSPRAAGGPRLGAGPAAALAWAPDGGALCVGWARGGLRAWTPAGCALFSSAAGRRNDEDDGAADRSRPFRLEDGARALAWGAPGRLFLLQAGGTAAATRGLEDAPPTPPSPCRCLELALARALPTTRSGPPPAMLADDGLLLGAAATGARGGAPLALARPPAPYLAANWPLALASLSPDGATAAVAGATGVALVALRPRAWRLFGDAAQEAAVAVSHIAWLPKMVVLVGAPPAPPLARALSGAAPPRLPPPPPPELYLYPRFHLDRTSLLARRRLPSRPVAVDGAGGCVLVALEGGARRVSDGGGGGAGVGAPLDILLLRVDVGSPIEPSLPPPRCALTAVRSLSVLGAGPPAVDAALAFVAASDAATTPHHALLRRAGGFLALLDLETGAETTLARSGVERFWLPPPPDQGPPGRPPGDGPWCAYGEGGMRVWLPSDVRGLVAGGGGREAVAAATPPATPPDPELEFDPEAYPLAITACGDAALAARQRVVRAAVPADRALGDDPHATLPLFIPTLATQPLLSVVLRRLLAAGRLEEAGGVVAARRDAVHAGASLEWLLFTSLDAARSTRAAADKCAGGTDEKKTLEAAADAATLLLRAAALAARPHAHHAAIAVAVARKTDAAAWPALFAAVGPPGDLVADAVAGGALDVAAAALVVVDRVQGSAAAHGLALALLKAALEEGRHALAADVARFVVPPSAGGALSPGAAEAPPPPSTSWWSSVWGAVAPPPPPPGAARGRAEDGAAAAAAWRLVAGAARRAVEAMDVVSVASLDAALACVGADAAAAVAAGGGGGDGGAPPAATGASVRAALHSILDAAPGVASLAPSPEGGADRAVVRSFLRVARAARSPAPALAAALALADGAAIAAILDEHAGLWESVAEALAGGGLPARVAAAVEGARVAVAARRGGAG